MHGPHLDNNCERMPPASVSSDNSRTIQYLHSISNHAHIYIPPRFSLIPDSLPDLQLSVQQRRATNPTLYAGTSSSPGKPRNNTKSQPSTADRSIQRQPITSPDHQTKKNPTCDLRVPSAKPASQLASQPLHRPQSAHEFTTYIYPNAQNFWQNRSEKQIERSPSRRRGAMVARWTSTYVV